MADEVSMEAAVDRLLEALKRLETVSNRRAGFERTRASLENAVQTLEEDRSELARKLDAAEARAARLEDTNRTVSRRLVAAMEKVRALLEETGFEGPPR